MLNFENNTPLKIVLLILTALSIQVNTLENNRSERDSYRPIQGKVYFGIAVAISGQSFSKAFNKTLTNITQNHLYGSFKKFSYNISLEPLVIELPENGSFSSFLLEHLCDLFEGKHVVGVLVVGSSPAAFTVSLTARHAGIPVLWARGHSEFLPGFRNMVHQLVEIMQLLHWLKAPVAAVYRVDYLAGGLDAISTNPPANSEISNARVS